MCVLTNSNVSAVVMCAVVLFLTGCMSVHYKPPAKSKTTTNNLVAPPLAGSPFLRDGERKQPLTPLPFDESIGSNSTQALGMLNVFTSSDDDVGTPFTMTRTKSRYAIETRLMDDEEGFFRSPIIGVAHDRKYGGVRLELRLPF